MTVPTHERPAGICLRDVLDHAPSEATDVTLGIAAAGAIGASALLLPSVMLADPDLSLDRLRHVGAQAESAGITLSASLPPVHPDRIAAAWGDDASAPTHAFAQLEAGPALGVAAFHVTVGVEEDRLSGLDTWRDQLERTVSVLSELVARSVVPIVLKTHEEMTSGELRALLDVVPGLRVGLSPVNVVARLENPVEVARRLSGAVHTVFLDDCVVTRAPDGLARRMRTFGRGSIDWEGVWAAVPDALQVVDLHRAELRMPVYDMEWWAHEPHVDAPTVARFFALADDDSPDHTLSERTECARSLLSLSKAPHGALGAFPPSHMPLR